MSLQDRYRSPDLGEMPISLHPGYGKRERFPDELRDLAATDAGRLEFGFR